jgi:N-acetylglucosamine kinase-like BadF-type ATPase
LKLIFAYDGGGTKTRLNVIDLSGNILYDEITTGSNIYSAGNKEFRRIIEGLYNNAKSKLKISDDDIEIVYLGLSGADLEEDYANLYQACNPIFNSVKHIIVNDAWIILRSGLSKPYGAVCICGTGTNSAAINSKKDKAILRALSYTLGTFGGGLDIARDALHYAFRADELTYQDTLLRTEIPKLLNVKDMEAVIPLFYPKTIIDKNQYGSITGLVGKCALQGDQVSIMILENVAKHIALQTVGVIKQVHMENEEVPVVIGGRVFQIEPKEFMNSFKETLLSNVEKARIVIPKFNPVIGAYLFALDELGIEQTLEIENNLLKSGGKL